MTADYLIVRDADESQRLVKQHDLWTKILGYRIHPTIAKNLLGKEGYVRIADVGCGTGTWLMDISNQANNPSWQFDGFDISSEQFPDQNPASAAATTAFLQASKGMFGTAIDVSALPSNIELRVQDMRKPFPAEYHGTYDLVHARLLLAALYQHEWATVVANLRSLLKPGGWLQWEEINVAPHMEILRSTPFPQSSTCLQKATNYMRDSMMHKIDNVHRLLFDAYNKAGMNNVETDVTCSDRMPELRAESTLLQMHVIRNIGRKRFELDLPNAWSLEEIEKIYNGTYEEVSQGAYINYYIHCVIGQL